MLDKLSEIQASAKLAGNPISDRSIAESIGISHALLSLIRNGKRPLTPDIEQKITDYLANRLRGEFDHFAEWEQSMKRRRVTAKYILSAMAMMACWKTEIVKYGKPLFELEQRDWNKVTDSLILTRKLSDKNHISYVKKLLQFLSFVEGNGAPKTWKLPKFERPKVEQPNVEHFEPAEWAQFRQYYLTHSDEPLKKDALFSMLLSGGFRITELLSIDLIDVVPHPLGGATVHLVVDAAKGRRTKTNKERNVHIEQEAYERYLQYIATLSPEITKPFWGKSARNNIEQYCAEARLKMRWHKKLHPHMLRHTCAVWMIRAGVDVVDISKHLGHAKIDETVRTYLGSYGYEDVAKAHIKAHIMKAVQNA